MDDLPDPQKDEDRVKAGKDEWLVMLGLYTSGCVPLKDKGDFNGWFVLVMVHITMYQKIRKDQLQRVWNT